jgi:hypothetical protein
MLLSQAEECLLNYRQAIECLEKSLAITGTRDRRSLKRLAQLRGYLAEWSALPLTPEQLRQLGDHLRNCGANDERNGRTLHFTNKWIEENRLPNREEILSGLADRGGFTDFQILYNVVRG